MSPLTRDVIKEHSLFSLPGTKIEYSFKEIALPARNSLEVRVSSYALIAQRSLKTQRRFFHASASRHHFNFHFREFCSQRKRVGVSRVQLHPSAAPGDVYVPRKRPSAVRAWRRA